MIDVKRMQLHSLALRTQEAYLLAVRQLAKYCRKSPDQIEEEELRQYFLFLKKEKPAARATCTLALCGIKFFYLAPYIYRVALSNRRLICMLDSGSMQSSQITFQYRTSDTGQLKPCTLSVEKFIQGFLQHVLPKGFVKVRYYGFFGATRRTRLAALQQQLGKFTAPLPLEKARPPTDQTPAQAKLPCPQYGLPMLYQRTLPPTLCRPP